MGKVIKSKLLVAVFRRSIISFDKLSDGRTLYYYIVTMLAALYSRLAQILSELEAIKSRLADHDKLLETLVQHSVIPGQPVAAAPAAVAETAVRQGASLGLAIGCDCIT